MTATQFLTSVWPVVTLLLGSGATYLIQTRLARREHARRARAEKRARLLGEFTKLSAFSMDLWRLAKIVPDALRDKIEKEPKHAFGRIFGVNWDEKPWLDRIKEAEQLLIAKRDELNMAAEFCELELGYQRWAPYRDLIQGLTEATDVMWGIGRSDESDAAKLPQVEAHVDKLHERVKSFKVAMIEELQKLEESGMASPALDSRATPAEIADSRSK